MGSVKISELPLKQVVSDDDQIVVNVNPAKPSTGRTSFKHIKDSVFPDFVEVSKTGSEYKDEHGNLEGYLAQQNYVALKPMGGGRYADTTGALAKYLAQEGYVNDFDTAMAAYLADHTDLVYAALKPYIDLCLSLVDGKLNVTYDEEEQAVTP